MNPTLLRALASAVLALGAVIAVAAVPTAAAGEREFATQVVADGLDQPAYATFAPGDATRLFIVELPGRIRILDLETGILQAQPFIDINPIVQGQLLSVAFDPGYQDNGYLYCYFLNTVLDTEIRRYSVTEDPNAADPLSGLRIIKAAQPQGSHNGGWIGFGPDGYLYLPLGDGAFEAMPTGLSQQVDTLLGKLIRLDVSGDAFPEDPDRNYIIPPTNPFIGLEPRDEIWSFGLRNPFRASFDRLTGDLYLGDVGQSQWEEIDWIPAGSGAGMNFGWPCLEGTRCTVFGLCDCADPLMIQPILEYPHMGERAVMGGYVYRGERFPQRNGWYFFGDYSTGQVWMMTHDAGADVVLEEITFQVSPSIEGTDLDAIVSFAENSVGELYIVSLQGFVFELVSGDLAPTADLDGDGVVGVGDLLILLAAWGPCPPEGPCPADLDVSGAVGVTDLLTLLAAWGSGG